MDLTEAFALPNQSIVALVGGGGKTSLMFSLAREARDRGRSALVTASTRFTRPAESDDFGLVTTTDEEAVAHIRGASWAQPMIATTGDGRLGRLQRLAPPTGTPFCPPSSCARTMATSEAVMGSPIGPPATAIMRSGRCTNCSVSGMPSTSSPTHRITSVLEDAMTGSRPVRRHPAL